MSDIRSRLPYEAKVYLRRALSDAGFSNTADYQISPEGTTLSLRIHGAIQHFQWTEVVARPMPTPEDDPGEYLRTTVEMAMEEVSRLAMMARIAEL